MSGWFLRSMGDRDTHRGVYSPATRSVHARCGVEFPTVEAHRWRTHRPHAGPSRPGSDLSRMPREGHPVSGLDIGQRIKLLLLERVHERHITGYDNLYYDAGWRIWSGTHRDHLA